MQAGGQNGRAGRRRRAGVLACALAAGCASVDTGGGPGRTAAGREPPFIVRDAALHAAFQKQAAALLEQGNPTPVSELKRQLARPACRLDLPAAGTRRMTPAEIYRQRAGSVVLVSLAHHCASPKCKKAHFNNASGVIIRNDGVLVTNYHVVNSSEPKPMGLCAMTFDGKAFLVDEVLAADKRHDVAILKLRGARGLPAAPLFRDEPVGNAVTLIAHPKGKLYTLTQGWISRYHLEKDERCVMSITADYAVGSSGGPVFNDRGDVVGIACTTQSIAEPRIPLGMDPETKSLSLLGLDKESKPAKVDGESVYIGLNPQMTVKDAVPSRAIFGLTGGAAPGK